VLPLPVLRELAEWVQEQDLLVISDEIYAELCYVQDHVSIASLPGMRERTILLHGFSKAWAMTGFRIGYACAPPELTEAMMTIHQYTMLCAPTLSQLAAHEALRRASRDVSEMRRRYMLNRNYMEESLCQIGLQCTPLAGAFYAFPYIGELGLSSEAFALGLLEQENVAVVPGTAFGSAGEGHVRCSYATSFEDIKEAMTRIACYVQQVRE
jgi:aminotransferase